MKQKLSTYNKKKRSIQKTLEFTKRRLHKIMKLLEIEKITGKKLEKGETENFIILYEKKRLGELFQIFDSEDKPVIVEGKKLLFYREECHGEGSLGSYFFHRGSNVFLVDRDKVYIQCRGEDKDLFPGYADLAAGEHLKIGESYDAGAIRGLKEEAGINVDKSRLKLLFKKKILDPLNKEWASYYRVDYDGEEIKLSKESKFGAWISLKKLKDPGFLKTFRRDQVEALEMFLRK